MNGNQNENKFTFSDFLIFAILIIGFFLIVSRNTFSNDFEKIPYSSFVTMLSEGDVESVVLEEDGSYIEGKLKDGAYFKTTDPNTEESKNIIYNSGADIIVKKNVMPSFGTIITLIVVLVFVITVFRIFRRPSGGGKSDMFTEGLDTEGKSSDVKFSDVAGNDECKDELNELVYYLKNPEKYAQYGITSPKGVMLYGPPGTGKTLLAKAVAGEADAHFMAVNGSDFVDRFVGNGAARVRKLFAEAKSNQPCILFIDEIDAVGGKRGGVNGHEERHQTLNALLSEIDGFSTGDNVIVIGATNRLDCLDEALLRSGRFDTKVYIGLPDVKAREEIFNVHARNKPISEDVDFKLFAKMTTYFSGADISTTLNRAGFYAAKRDSEFIEKTDIDKAIGFLVAGDEKKNKDSVTESDKKLTAYHEAGHAIVALKYAKLSVSKVTIIPTTKGAGGYTMLDEIEKMCLTKEDLLSKIAVSLGGRAVEEIVFGERNVSTGASQDLKHATEIAVNMVASYGMSNEFGLLSVSGNVENKEVLKAAKSILDCAYEQVIGFLRANMDDIELLVESLLEKETVLADDLNEMYFNANDEC